MPLLVTPRLLQRRAEFYRQLASLLGAGVGMLQAIDLIRRNPPGPAFQRSLAQIHQRLQGGSTFAEASGAEVGWLPGFDLALIEAGEQSGRLVESCQLLAGYYEQRAQLARSVLANLAYPVVLIHFAVLIFPTTQLTALVRSGDVLGFVTAKLLWLLPAYAGVWLLVLAGQGQRAPAWRAGVERLLRAIPALGTARRDLALARLSAALEALINAGVSIVEAWTLAAEASGSPALVQAVRRWRSGLDGGQTPGELLQRTAAFPEMFANLYFTGETAGRLDETLRRLHRHYQEEGSRRLHLVAQWAPRLIYLLVLLTVAYQIVSFWAGYYGGMRELYDF